MLVWWFSGGLTTCFLGLGVSCVLQYDFCACCCGVV